MEYFKEEAITKMGASYLNTFRAINDANFKYSLVYLQG